MQRKELENHLPPSEYRAQVIAQNRTAVSIFRAAIELVEDVITGTRPHREPFDLAVELLFIQAYKSTCSIYALVIRGHEEDAATISRRLLEITAQVAYVEHGKDRAEHNRRGEAFLDHNPDHGGYFWGGTWRDLFKAIGREDAYEADYRFLAQIAHTSAARLASALREGEIRIRTTASVSGLLMYASRNLLLSMKVWNTCFGLIDAPRIEGLLTEVRQALEGLRSERSSEGQDA